MKIRKNIAKLAAALMLTGGLGVAGAETASAEASCSNHVEKVLYINSDKWVVFKITPTNCYSYHYKYNILKRKWIKQPGYGVCWRQLAKGHGGC